jgi:hypothetical protein
MARWLSPDGPWNTLNVVGQSGTYEANDARTEQVEDGWSVKAEQGSDQSEETSGKGCLSQ